MALFYLAKFLEKMDTLFGIKGRMTQTFIEGFRIPVAKINLGPCRVLGIKNMQKDGYWALQLGFQEKKTSKKTPKNNQNKFKFIKEVRFMEEPKYKVGDTISISDIFKIGDIVNVSGITKGKGFAGGVRRYNFRGGPKTHGQSDRHRAPGSIGQTTTPGRVYKGKRMAGRMGSDLVTIKNLHVVNVYPELNQIDLSGPVPGRFGSFLTVRKIKSGSLHDLEKETVAQVVEVETPADENKEGVKNEG